MSVARWNTAHPETPVELVGVPYNSFGDKLTSAIDQPPYEPVTSALVSGLRDEPSLDVLAGWLATRIDGPVQRAVGELKVDLVLPSETITLRRP